MKNPKILVFTVSSWNSRVGSNTWATLLEQFNSENIANICIRDEQPNSSICSRYFSISESRIIKSVLNRKIKTGREIFSFTEQTDNIDLIEHTQRYKKYRKKRRYSMLLARELAWKLGKWKTKELDAFLDDFKPDVILHSMEGYIHLNRIVQYAIKRTGAKAVGYIWDDNFTYKQSSALGYKVYRFFQRKSLKKLAKNTQAFFAITPKTKKEADEFFKIDCKVITKPLNSEPIYKNNKTEYPVKILYTGNLLIGRDRSLVKVVRALKPFNDNGIKYKIDVYTGTEINEKIKREIDCEYCVIHEPIPQKDVLKLQKQADVLLFLEDIDGPDAKFARLSFSTKITDYLSSGKAILAVGNEDTAPMQYFIYNDCAFVATDENSISKIFGSIEKDINLINVYAEKSCDCGIKNHSKETILQNVREVIVNL